MAIQLRGDSYRILFRYRGKQQAFPLGPVSEAEARAKSAQVDYVLLRLKQRLIEIPTGVDIVDFLRFDGMFDGELQPKPLPRVSPLATSATSSSRRGRAGASNPPRRPAASTSSTWSPPSGKDSRSRI